MGFIGLLQMLIESKSSLLKDELSIYENPHLNGETDYFSKVMKYREMPYYNLDMIISLGYRVKSKIATNFRRCATEPDYVEHLENVLKTRGEKVLQGAETISHAQAIEKATQEYHKYEVQNLSPVEEEYLENIKNIHSTVKKRGEN